MKTLGTILIVLLVTAAFGTAIYFIAQAIMQSGGLLPGGNSQSRDEFAGDPLSIGIVSGGEETLQLPEGEGGGSGNGPRGGMGNGRGGGGGGGGEELPAGQSWFELLKDMAIIGGVTLIVALIPKVFRRKKAVESVSLV